MIDRPHCPERKCGLLSGAPHQPHLLEGSPYPCRQASWPQGVESNCMSIGSACSVQEHLIIIARAPARRQRDHKSVDHWEPPKGWSFREAPFTLGRKPSGELIQLLGGWWKEKRRAGRSQPLGAPSCRTYLADVHADNRVAPPPKVEPAD